MRNAFRIGRIGGIEIRIDSSWFFIFVIVTWSLASTFAAWHPDWQTATTLLTALAAALAFFASVLLHELAHCAVARAFKLPVRSITLHLFGGVSNIEREPPSPSSELLIAFVGPLTSIGLGVAMMTAGSVIASYQLQDVLDPIDKARAMGPLATLLLWAGPVNVMLGVFNLLPGLPLDGGRVLRALLWKTSGDVRSATRASAMVGQLLGWALVIAGAFMFVGLRVPFFGSGTGSGLWLVLLGWFLRGAAIASFRSSIVEELVDGVRVDDLMRRTGPWLPQNARIATYADTILWRGEDQGYPVLDADGRLVGLVTPSDVQAIPPQEFPSRSVASVMTPLESLAIATPGMMLLDALRTLQRTDARQLPVVRPDGVLDGMLYERDILRWLEFATPPRRGGMRPRMT
jgi:Zn-dependent protease